MSRTSALRTAALCLVVLAGCTGGASAERSSGGFVREYGITVVPPDEREDAPPITGETLEGEQLALADYTGRTVLLNIWGSWCGPCIEEADDLVAAERELGGVAFVGLNIRDDEEAARAFERAHDITWPSIFDRASENLLGLPRELAASATPTTYVIDGQGAVAARLLGPQSAQTFVDVVEEVRHG